MARRKKQKLIGLLLDETGSMADRHAETIVSVNQFFKDADAEAKVTFATFNSSTGVAFRCGNVAPSAAPMLNEQNYRPVAFTPLLDAIGKMVAHMETVAQAGDKVLIAIVTDGHENASREYSLEAVKALIERHTEAGWAFAYIGAAPEAWDGNRSIGVDAGASLNPDRDVQGAMQATGHAMGAYFAGRVTSKNLYEGSRHLVQERKADD